MCHSILHSTPASFPESSVVSLVLKEKRVHKTVAPKTWRRTVEMELREKGLRTWEEAASAVEDRTAGRQRAYSPILHQENG